MKSTQRAIVLLALLCMVAIAMVPPFLYVDNASAVFMRTLGFEPVPSVKFIPVWEVAQKGAAVELDVPLWIAEFLFVTLVASGLLAATRELDKGG